MKMKKVLLLFIANITLISLFGCGQNSEKPVESTGVQASEQQENLVNENEEQEKASKEGENKNPDEETNQSQNEKQQDTNTVDLSKFNLTKKNFPKMDGSTSLAPLGQALASALTGKEKDKVEDLIQFNKTTQSYRNLMYGGCDLILASWPNEAVFDEMKTNGFECEMEEISTEALVFVVNENNPVNSLTTEQIRGIYTGEITNWSQVGGADLAIDAFQRNTGSGSQALMEKLVMQDTPMQDPPVEYMVSTMGELMEAVRNYDNSASAIGYSVYYYANDMKMAEGLKIIAVDGVEPNASTIRNKEYPHTNAYYCAISAFAGKDSAERAIYDWLVTEDGQRLVASEGYVSVIDTGIQENGKVSANRFTRLQEDFIPDLKSGKYQQIYPFIGEDLYENYVDGGGIIGHKYGFIDETGCIIADPTYLYCENLHYYDDDGGVSVPFWIMSRNLNEVVPEDYYSKSLWGLASYDGSIVKECKYDYISASKDGILLVWKTDDKLHFEFMDYNGKILFDDKKFGESKITNIELSLNVVGAITISFDYMDSSYLVDLKGNIILGPYGNINYYDNGKACVLYNDMYGVVKADGTEVIPIEYEYVYGEKGYYVATKGNKRKLFDENGNLIETATSDDDFYFDKAGNYNVRNWLDSNQPFSAYDRNKNEVYYVDIPKENEFCQDPYYYTVEGKSIRVEDKLSGKNAYLEDCTGIEAIPYAYEGDEIFPTSGENIMFMTYGEEDGAKHRILDKDLNVLFEIKDGYTACYVDPITMEMYIGNWDYDNDQFTIYNLAGEKVAKLHDNIHIMNGIVFGTDDYSTKAFDAEGNEIFSYFRGKSVCD